MRDKSVTTGLASNVPDAMVLAADSSALTSPAGAELARCDREIAAARTGNGDLIGSAIGDADWHAERALILKAQVEINDAMDAAAS